MARCLELAKVAAATDLPILILGESGTGKTLLAEAIHNSSRRAGKPFVSFNGAALSETLVDSQRFGHEKGASTGAHQRV
jgi:propionate catabolism operon transcriptional regulator